jgi:hypothetical protein
MPLGEMLGLITDLCLTTGAHREPARSLVQQVIDEGGESMAARSASRPASPGKAEEARSLSPTWFGSWPVRLVWTFVNAVLSS